MMNYTESMYWLYRFRKAMVSTCDGFCKINRKQKESIYESISLRFFKY